MTPRDHDDTARERSADAGEYVLGTMDAQARAAFERDMANDTALQAEVYAWQDRLLGLARSVEPVQPPASLWRSIEARLAATPRATAARGGGMGANDMRADDARGADRSGDDTSVDRVRARPSPATPPRAEPRTAANDPLWQRLRRWQITSGVAMAASVLFGTLLLLRAPGVAPTGADPAARYLAVLQAPDDKSTGWVVEVTGDKVRLVPVGTTAAVPVGKALQFWTKPEGAAGPTSLGLVRAGQVTELPLSRLPAVQAQTLFELTLEPEAGSPIGRPTGPILYVGRSVRM